MRSEGGAVPGATLEPGPSSDAAAGSGRSGHPVRDKLLAKARAAAIATAPGPAPAAAHSTPPTHSNQEHPSSDSSLGPGAGADGFLGFAALPPLVDDLDLIGAPEHRRELPPTRSAPPLTAPAALLLGTLFGVTGMAVLFAVLIQLAPHAPFGSRAQSAELAPPPAAAAVRARERSVRRPPRQRQPGPWRIADADDTALERAQGSVGSSSFLVAMQSAGINLREAYRVMTAFEGVKDLNKCRPRDAFSALLDATSGRLTAFEYVVSDEEVYQARESKQGLLIGQKLDLKVRRERVEGALVMHGGFDDSALEAGFEPGLSEIVDKAFAGYTSVAEMKTGDVLALVLQEVTVLGEFSRYAGVEALEYRPVGAEPLRVYYHETEKTRGYVDSKGRVFGKSRWARPVPGAAVTSRFNPKRIHPILKVVKPHNGTDFGAAVGTPVVAAAFGKVVFAGEAGPNGNMITLSHSGGYSTGYSHLSKFARGLKVGDRVEQKQLIGYVGSTGRSTGPHLHFSAKKNDRFIDPESLNLDAFSKLPPSDRQLLSQLRQRYDKMLNGIPIPEAPLPEVALLSAPVHEQPLVSQATAAPTATVDEGAAGPRMLHSIYLTDQELIRQQPVVHDGEIDP